MNTNSYMGIALDLAKLPLTEELLAALHDYGPTDRTLADFRNSYEKEMGKDLIWRFPLSDGCHYGTVIVPVREGFLSLPFNEVDADDNEIYLPEKACLMTREALDDFCNDLKSYTQGFCSAMEEAKILMTLKEFDNEK